tara:strand:+ start:1206 stop:1655 length:450 start_codon:yes stop_codon:yes gene_type:complete
MKIHLYKFIKYLFLILIFYNIFSLIVLFTSNYSIKLSFWKATPYDYKYIIDFPNYFKKLSLKEDINRNNIKTFLNINSKRNILDLEFWNYILIIDSYSKENNNSFERSFTNLFFLAKKNKIKNSDLKVYFIKNYNLFSENTKLNVLRNY